MLYEIEQNYNNNKLFYMILDNQNNICENVFNKISVLIDNFVPIKDTDAPIRGRSKRIPNYKYKNKAKKRFELEYKTKQPQIEEEKPQKYHLYGSGACL